jgi:hypothetical protein
VWLENRQLENALVPSRIGDLVTSFFSYSAPVGFKKDREFMYPSFVKL